MQSQAKEVVKTITHASTLECELQVSQAQHGVAVLDIYNSEWSSSKALGETFRRLFTDAGDLIHLRFFAVECDTVLKNLENPSDAPIVQRPKGIEFRSDTLTAAWSPILQSRVGRSKPYFLFYKEGKLRGHIEGIDTPKICKMVQDLCKPRQHVSAYITNADALAFWERNFPPKDDEVSQKSFMDALQKELNVVMDEETREAVAQAISASDNLVSATGLQCWVGNDGTLANCVTAIVEVLQERAKSAPPTAPPSVPPSSPPLVPSPAPRKLPANRPLQFRDGASGGTPSICEVPTCSGDDEPHELAEPSAVEEAPTAGTGGASESPSATPHPQLEVEPDCQIFTDRWITVTPEEMRVWSLIAKLPLPYPHSTSSLLIPCEEAEERAAALLHPEAPVPTLGSYLLKEGVTEADLNMMCLAANQKVGSDSLFYGKLSLVLMPSDADGTEGLLPTPTNFAEEVCDGTLLQKHAPVGFTVLCLCACEAYLDEVFYYIPCAGETKSILQLEENSEIAMSALTPLRANAPTEDQISCHIMGYPKVVELATTQVDGDTVVLSPWFSKLTVVSKTGTTVTLQFVEFILEDLFQDFTVDYVASTMEAEKLLDKRLLSPTSSAGTADTAEALREDAQVSEEAQSAREVAHEDTTAPTDLVLQEEPQADTTVPVGEEPEVAPEQEASQHETVIAEEAMSESEEVPQAGAAPHTEVALQQDSSQHETVIAEVTMPESEEVPLDEAAPAEVTMAEGEGSRNLS